ncbi:MAG: endonuclease, partial [Bacteroidaceae bacterium]|nr:endonuclease [Bacteroidaceae bacterium]
MTTKRLFTTICTLALTLCMAWAQGPNGSENYYQDADGKKGAALKTALCKIIYSRTEVIYDDIWSAFETTDLRSDGKIWDMYSNITNYRYITDQAGNYQKEGDKYNREHSFPKSWFGGKESSVPGHDLFHIYPTDGFVNGKRSNYPFGENNGEEYSSSGNFSKLGKCTYPGCTYIGDKEYVFEPNDKYKGDFARTYFYMVTCYEEQLSTWYKNYANSNEGLKATIDGSTYPAFTTWQLNMLLDWSRNDPVSEKEINRNNAVYDLQKNRNPFIDYPGLEDYIWGDKKNVTFSYDHYDGSSSGKQPVTMSFSPTSVTATLGESFTAPTLSMSPSGLTVTYSSSNTNVATVNASTGAVTLKAVGTTTITASFAGNDDYYSNSATYTLTVKKQGGDDPTPVETIIWEEDWTGASSNVSVESINNSSAVYQGDGGTNCKIYNEKLAGGTAPELLIPKTSRDINYFIATIALGHACGEMPLSFKCNKTISVTST